MATTCPRSDTTETLVGHPAATWSFRIPCGRDSARHRATFRPLITWSKGGMKPSNRIVCAALIGGLLLAGCSGSSSTGESADSSPTEVVATAAPVRQRTAEPIILRSSDGAIEFEVPAGSVFEDTQLEIESVDPAEVPGLEGTVAVGSAYTLHPAEVAFGEPIIVTFRAPVESGGVVTGVPLWTVAMENDGNVERLDEQRAEFFGLPGEREVHHQFLIERFGTLVILDAGVTFELDPHAIVELAPGDSFDATISASVDADVTKTWPDWSVEARWLSSGGVSAPDSPTPLATFDSGADPAWTAVNVVACEVVGTGSFTVEVGVDVETHLDEAALRQFVTLIGTSNCGDVGRG